MDIGKALKQLRNDLGLTQAEMIHDTKVTVSHYSKMEKGQNRIFVENLIEILNQRNISLSYFFDKYLANKNNDTKIDYSELLNIAFYKKDKTAAEKIKQQIFSDKSSSNELKNRALLIVDVIDNKSNKNIDSKIINTIFKYENWTQYDEAIVILSNTIRTNNLINMTPLVLTLVRKYANLGKEKIKKQRRLATVGINYLFNLRKISKIPNETAIKIINWIRTASAVPELGIIRELNIYFWALYENDTVISYDIKNILKLAGYENLSDDLPD